VVIYSFGSIGGATGDDDSYNSLYDTDNKQVQIQDITPQDPVSIKPITAEQLLEGGTVSGLTANYRWAPPVGAKNPSVGFAGTLQMQNAEMGMSPEFRLGKGSDHSGILDDKDTTIFPNVAIQFITVDDRLVPVSQNVIANGTLKGTQSYWDIIVQ